MTDASGRVLANGRPDRFHGAVNTNVSNQRWFRDALATSDGAHFAVADIEPHPVLNNEPAPTYAAAIRDHGDTGGRPIGVLGIFFDWRNESQSVVDGVRLEDDEKGRTRCLLLDADHRIIAASDRKGVLTERFPLKTDGQAAGSYKAADGSVVGFSRTPGYQTYRGLGWHGVIVQSAIVNGS